MSKPDLSVSINNPNASKSKELPKDGEYSRFYTLDRVQFLKDLKQLLGMEFSKEVQAESTPIYVINRARIRDVASFMKSRGYQLQALVASDLISNFELNYLYHFSPFIVHSQIIIQTQIDKSVAIPTISDIFDNAQYQELNLTHRLGTIFALPPQKIQQSESGGEKQAEIQGVLCVPTQIQIPSKTKTPYQYGIFHPIHRDRQYFDLNVVNGQIKKIELVDGWGYKNVHSLLEKRNPFTDFNSIFESISPNACIHLYIAYYQGLEVILEKKVPAKAKYIRTLLAELERIRSHLIWFSNLAYLVGMDSIFSEIIKYIQKIEELNQIAFKNPYLYNTVKYGGSADILMKDATHYYRFLKDFGRVIFETLYNFVYSMFLMEKCKNIGIISSQNARSWALSGPVIRATGIASDIRLNEPYLNYNSGDLSQNWNVICFQDGDVFARTQVRLWELRESIEICTNVLIGLSNYEIPLKIEEIPQSMAIPQSMQMIQTVESPQGALSVYFRSEPKKALPSLYTVRIMTPDLNNFAALSKMMLPNQNIRNLPLILHSLDMNFQMIDL